MKADEDIVLYVGQSGNTITRLRTHLVGGFGKGRSDLGDCFQYNRPKSYEWIFEEYTVAEAHDFLGIQGLPLHIDYVEWELIKRYRPCLNIAMNPDPTPLPDKYKWSVCDKETERDLMERIAKRAGIK